MQMEKLEYIYYLEQNQMLELLNQYMKFHSQDVYDLLNLLLIQHIVLEQRLPLILLKRLLYLFPMLLFLLL